MWEMLQHFKSEGNSPVWLPLTTPTGQTGWRQPKLIQVKSKLHAGSAHSSSPGQAAVASPAPQKPSACFHAVASGTSQPGLHHHTLLHPPPAGKSPAAGWPLSTGLVLLHEMNRCGVGVGETGCGERSRGRGAAGWGSLGTAGSSRQLSSQPAWLSGLSPQQSPRDCWIWPFLLAKPRQRRQHHKPHQR